MPPLSIASFMMASVYVPEVPPALPVGMTVMRRASPPTSISSEVSVVTSAVVTKAENDPVSEASALGPNTSL